MNDFEGKYLQWRQMLFSSAGSGIPLKTILARKSHGTITYLGALFTEISDLTRVYPEHLIDQVIIEIYETTSDWLELLLETPGEDKATLFESMYNLYGGYALQRRFGERSYQQWSHIERVLNMWWDGLVFGEDRTVAGAVDCEHSYNQLELSTREIIDVILIVLTRILSIPNRFCQLAALHGLNHICHPDAASTVQAYIDINRNTLISWGILAYAEACRDAKES